MGTFLPGTLEERMSPDSSNSSRIAVSLASLLCFAHSNGFIGIHCQNDTFIRFHQEVN
jgi:hypothetical protein